MTGRGLESGASSLRTRTTLLALGSLVALGVISLISLSIGPSNLGFEDVVHSIGALVFGAAPEVPNEGAMTRRDVTSILWSLRAPRIIVAATVGASLALAGALLQGLFRNVLAAPGVIGTSAGASFGAVLALSLGWSSLSLWTLPGCAMAGAFVSLLIVVRIARTQGRTPVSTLLLAGVALTAFLSALNGWLLARSYQDFELARRIAYWILGGVADRGWEHVGIAMIPLLIGTMAALVLATDLDLMLQGEETAATLGVNVERSKQHVLIVAAILVGSAVSVAGVIGFVGLVVPHVVRMLIGPAHRALLITSTVVGATFLVAADLLARTIAASELQLGVVTAFVGAPFFLYLLTQQRTGEFQ